MKIDRLRGTRVKIDRADKHIADFDAALTAFEKEGPYERLVETDAAGIQKCTVRLTGPLPSDLVGSIGDAIHNLRSALDHLAFAVAETNGVSGNKLRKVSFTIRETKKDLKKALDEREISRIGAAWLGFVETVEPYVGGSGEDLYAINVLDNIDKHRALIAIETQAQMFSVNERGEERVFGWSPLDRGATVSAFSDDPKISTSLRPRVMFEETCRGEPVRPVLDRFRKAVARVLADAAGDPKLFP